MRLTSSRFLRLRKASNVALTWLIGLFDPKLLATISFTPAISSTALILEPAITPVPAGAGFKRTLAPSQSTTTSCGIEVPSLSNVVRSFLASSPPFLMASDNSLALANPNPTRPFLSPTSISAEKLNFRPPLSTLVQRFTNRTFSSNSDYFTSS